MRSEETEAIAEALGGAVSAASTLAGGFSHETCLVTYAGGRVVARLGGPDPGVEAAVMATARRHVPVPEVLAVLPATERTRPVMLVEYVPGELLARVLATGDGAWMRELGAEVGRVVAGIAAVRFERRGFFTDASLTAGPERPWSEQLPAFADKCMAGASESRLDEATRRAWAALCEAHAPALAAVDDHARLVHADVNPKNILVARTRAGWRVEAVLDWEFAYSGCPYGDAANMARFGHDYPAAFLDGFRAGFAGHPPAGLPLQEDWGYLGRVLDMFALSDLVTRPPGHSVADQAAERIRHWVAEGVPRSL
ncbi:phosphotransferase [Actinoallomurus sp. NBC_01490]|uniref:phosphotransferase family protein n=1 Tax=Actinoallomurus sp. NBC_01490 TaxID=2903557 RepID=UPI002E363145|nr:phosphotransferase [Actinoallomurus sp. NBC_01490]